MIVDYEKNYSTYQKVMPLTAESRAVCSETHMPTLSESTCRSSEICNQYMWQNLIYSKEYREYFVKHKKDILSPRVNDIFSMGLSTTDQQKIVYGILLDDDELRQF